MSPLTAQKTSKEIFQQACQVIPGGVNSAARAFKNLGVDPLIAKKGSGAILTDADGREYIDYCQSFGALILGHCPSPVKNFVIEVMQDGFSFGLTNELEVTLAEMIIQRLGFIDKLRFVSSGTEAVMTALRLARGVTGKPYIVKFNLNYHGHLDPLLVHAGSGVHDLPKASSKGIAADSIKYTISLPYNQLDAAKEFFQNFDGIEEIAAIIVEPIAGNMGLVPADEKFLRYLREITNEIQSLLIFDEVISGFRLESHCAANLYRIHPDLITLGKIIGGGFPAAAVGGKAEVMDQLAPIGQVFQAGTLSGNPVAMAAGIATLKEMDCSQFHQKLAQKNFFLTNDILTMIEELDLPIGLNRLGPMFTIFFGKNKITSDEDLYGLDAGLFKKFFRYLLDCGIFFPPSQFETCFITKSHTEEQLEKTKKTIINFFIECFDRKVR